MVESNSAHIELPNPSYVFAPSKDGIIFTHPEGILDKAGYEAAKLRFISMVRQAQELLEESRPESKVSVQARILAVEGLGVRVGSSRNARKIVSRFRRFYDDDSRFPVITPVREGRHRFYDIRLARAA